MITLFYLFSLILSNLKGILFLVNNWIFVEKPNKALECRIALDKIKLFKWDFQVKQFFKFCRSLSIGWNLLLKLNLLLVASFLPEKYYFDTEV